MGNCVGNTTWKEVKNGINMLQKVLLKMKKWRFCVMLWSNVTEIKERKPDIIVVNKNERRYMVQLLSFLFRLILFYLETWELVKENIERCQELKSEIKRMWNIRNIKVIPVAVEALGSTPKKLKKYTEELGVVISTALLQNTALLGMAGILRKVLDCR